MTHTTYLLRAAATLAGGGMAVARGATLRQLITVPARLVRPQHRPVLRLPAHWPHAQACITPWHNEFRIGPAPPRGA